MGGLALLSTIRGQSWYSVWLKLPILLKVHVTDTRCLLRVWLRLEATNQHFSFAQARGWLPGP